MTNLTQNLDSRLNPHAPIVLSLFLVIFGLLFLCHASAHLFGWPSGPAAALGQWPYFYAGTIASGTMAFTFFTQHVPTGVIPMTNGGELAVLYCFAFFLLVFTGGGAIALDARNHRTSRVAHR